MKDAAREARADATASARVHAPWFAALQPDFEKCGNCGADATKFCTSDTAASA